MPFGLMEHTNDPREALKKEIADFLPKIKLANNQVLCAVYVRPEKTKSGLYLPEKTRDEDKIQGKVGLVVKLGPDAFQDDTGKWFKGLDIDLDDWVFFRPSDGWSVTINHVVCRILEDTNIRGQIDHPDFIW